jgi:WD40 repeat protein
VSVWDPVTGALLDRFDAGPGGERTAVPLPLPGRTALAYHSGDRTIGLWDPERGLVPVVVEHRQSVGRLCAVETGGRTLLAAVDDTYERHGDCVVTVPDDSRRNVIRVWDPGSGTPVSSLDCAFDVGMLHAFPAGTRMLLAGASSANGGSKLAEQCLHVWDPLSGALLWRGRGDSQGIAVACSVPLADRVLLATAGASHEVRLWDPASRLADDAAYDRDPEDDLRAGVETVHRVRAGGREVLAVLNNRYLRPGDGYPAASIADLLDPQSGRRLARLRPRGNKHIDQLVAAHFAAGGVLASTAQEIDTNYPSVDLDLWRPDTGMRLATMRKGDKRLAVWGAMCAFEADGKALLAMAPGGSGDVVVLQARRKGRIVAEFRVADRQVFALAAVPYRGAPALATASFDSAVRLWEPLTGRPLGSLDHGALLDEQGGRPADVLCPIPHGAGALLATARRHRGTVLLWDVETGALRARLACHPDDGNAFAIGGLCAFPLAGRLVLATGGSERHVRLWDALRARLMLDIPVHHRVSALAYDDGLLTVGTDAGLLTLRLVPAASAFR